MTDEKSKDKAPAATDERAVAASIEQVQEKVDEEDAQGFRGYNPDSTPNENYTFGGQAKGLPTPETDPEMAAKVGRPFGSYPWVTTNPAKGSGK